MPTKASSRTKKKGKVFFVAKSIGPLLGRLPLKLSTWCRNMFSRLIKKKETLAYSYKRTYTRLLV